MTIKKSVGACTVFDKAKVAEDHHQGVPRNQPNALLAFTAFLARELALNILDDWKAIVSLVFALEHFEYLADA